jgi:hypothetical protein
MAAAAAQPGRNQEESSSSRAADAKAGAVETGAEGGKENPVVTEAGVPEAGVDLAGTRVDVATDALPAKATDQV